MFVRTLLISTATAVLSIASANAAVLGSFDEVDFSDGSTSIELGGGAATYTFSDTGGFFDSVAIETDGAATIASLGAPFNDPARPTSYFTDDTRAPFIDGDLLATYLGYDDPVTIKGSGVDSYLALQFTLDDGVHYGYARVAGPTLFEFAYESEAGVGIQAGALPVGDIPVGEVPLPAAGFLFASALGGLGFSFGRRKPKAA